MARDAFEDALVMGVEGQMRRILAQMMQELENPYEKINHFITGIVLMAALSPHPQAQEPIKEGFKTGKISALIWRLRLPMAPASPAMGWKSSIQGLALVGRILIFSAPIKSFCKIRGWINAYEQTAVQRDQPQAQRIAVLRALDKITGRLTDVELVVGQIAEFETLTIARPHALKTPKLKRPNRRPICKLMMISRGSQSACSQAGCMPQAPA